MLIQKALLINEPELLDSNKDTPIDVPEDDEDLEFLDDPEGIAIPWEEKFGKKDNEDKNAGCGDKKQNDNN